LSKRLINYSFLIVAAALIVFEGFLISRGNWAGDFWEHSAVVRELSHHLTHPNNPIINSDLPHAFFSPYAVLVAIFCKISHFDSVAGLGLFAYLNLILLLFGIHFFCKNLFKENANRIATLSLIFILFFWGAAPFLWSGFYHIFILNKILPYPSTFAFALSLIAIGSIDSEDISIKKIIGLSFLYTIVLITHPPTAIFLTVMLLSICFYRKIKIGKGLLIIGAGALISLAWPYFNILDLLMDKNQDFANDSKRLYIGIGDSIHHYWPALLCIPAFLFIKKDRIILFFIVTIIALKLIYSVGFAFHFYAVSRVVSYIMVLSYILIAYFIFKLKEENITFFKPYVAVIALTFITSLFMNAESFKELSAQTKKKERFPWADYAALPLNGVTDHDLVLADEYSNYFIPSFGGKVLASHTPVYWLPDHPARRDAVRIFFEPDSNDSVRLEILKTWQPDFIFIDTPRVHLKPATIQFLKSRSTSVSLFNNFYIMKLNKQSLSLPW
jgi:hypothetical protein